MKKSRLNSRKIGYVARNIAVMVMAVFCLWLPNRVRSSDEGLEQALIFAKLGIVESSSGEYLAAYSDADECVHMLLKILGCGDASEATEYFRAVKMDTAPEFYRDTNGNAIEYESYMRMGTLYMICLKAQGVLEPTAVYTDAEVAETAAKAGYGFLSAGSDGLDTASIVTNGKLIKVLYEMFMTNAGGEPVYRILASINSEFMKKLDDIGLYDDIPVKYAPRYTNGAYSIGTFYSLEQTDGRMEWYAEYEYTTGGEADAFCAQLAGLGWTLEGTYYYEESFSLVSLYWKAHPDKPGTELGLVVRYAPDLLTNPSPDPVEEDNPTFFEGTSGTVTWCLIEGTP